MDFNGQINDHIERLLARMLGVYPPYGGCMRSAKGGQAKERVYGAGVRIYNYALTAAQVKSEI